MSDSKDHETPRLEQPASDAIERTMIVPTVAMVDAIDPADMPAIWRAVATAAQGGDMKAAEVARRWWRFRQRTVRIDLPAIHDLTAIAVAQAHLLALVGAGEITPREGRDVSVMIENRRKAIEMLEWEPTLHELNRINAEERRKKNGASR